MNVGLQAPLWKTFFQGCCRWKRQMIQISLDIFLTLSNYLFQMFFLSFGDTAEIEPVAKFYGLKKSCKSLESLKLRA